MPAADSRTEAYEQAGRYIVEHSDVLLAVWDGLPARGRGGTAEIVAWARDSDSGLPCVDGRGRFQWIAARDVD